MTNEISYFTCTGFFYAVTAPDVESDTNTDQFAGMTGGFVTFTPRVPAGFTVEVSDLDLGSGNTGSTAIALPPIVGRIMGTIVNGSPVWELCAINTVDSPGIQLLANTSAISTYLTARNITAGQLIYDVTFDFVTYNAANQYIRAIAFAAPTTATTVCITDPSFVTVEYLP